MNPEKTAQATTLIKIRAQYEKLKKIRAHKGSGSLSYLEIEDESDLLKISPYVQSIIISPKYNSSVSKCFQAISQHPQIKKLRVFENISYIMLDDDHLQNIESLEIFIHGNEPFIAFSLPHLKSLSIYAIDEPSLLDFSLEPVTFDFSFFPQLEKVRIDGWQSLDISSFSSLNANTNLILSDITIDSFEWLKNVPSLKSLSTTDDHYQSIEPIVRYQSQIENLSLRFIQAKDIEKLAQLHHLKSLDIQHGTITAEQENILRHSEIKELLINEVDQEIRSVSFTVKNMALETAGLLLGQEESNSPWLRTEIARDWNARAIEALQKNFLFTWESICDQDFPSKTYDILEPHRTDICRHFLECALGEYPSLLITAEMSNVLHGTPVLRKDKAQS